VLTSVKWLELGSFWLLVLRFVAVPELDVILQVSHASAAKWAELAHVGILLGMHIPNVLQQ